MTAGSVRPDHTSVKPNTRPTRPPAARARQAAAGFVTQATTLITKLTAIAVAKKVAVAASAAGEPIAFPLRPFPDVHPPARLAPRPMSTPAASRIGAIHTVFGPRKVSVSHP